MQTVRDGWSDEVRRVESTHCDERPPGERVCLLVLHAISLPPGEFGGDSVERLFTGRLDAAAHPYFRALAGTRVSAHFLVRRDGEVLQFVPVTQRAWHAGVSSWRGRPRCNDFSVGVELEGTDDTAFTDPQYRSLSRVARALCREFPVAAIAGHSDIAPGRKCDPGTGFDWPRLYASLLAA